MNNKKEGMKEAMRVVRALAALAIMTGEWKVICQDAIDKGLNMKVGIVGLKKKTERAIAWTMYRHEPWWDMTRYAKVGGHAAVCVTCNQHRAIMQCACVEHPQCAECFGCFCRDDMVNNDPHGFYDGPDAEGVCDHDWVDERADGSGCGGQDGWVLVCNLCGEDAPEDAYPDEDGDW